MLFLRHPLLPPLQRVKFAKQLEERILARKKEEEEEIRGVAPSAPPANSSSTGPSAPASSGLASSAPPAPTATKGSTVLPVIVTDRVSSDHHQSYQMRMASSDEDSLWSAVPNALLHRLRSLVLSNPERFAFYVAAFCLFVYMLRAARRKSYSGVWASIKSAVSDVLHMMSANPAHRPPLRH